MASVENPEEQDPQLIHALIDGGAEVQFVGELKRRLEDVYLELMGANKDNNHGKN